MHIHAIIHAEFEQPGCIEKWAQEKDYTFTTTHTYKGERLPEVNKFDFLIVMGGPQSPLKTDEWPYLQDEIDLIKQSTAANKAILGICLGAQLIAESLGAKTEKSPHREIGVYPIELLADAAKDPVFSQFPNTFPVMHWHNDMPGIPKEARLLAKSEGCPRQAFAVGDRIYGLQCHFEMTQDNIKDMLKHCENDLTSSRYVQSKQSLLSHDLTDINKKMIAILEFLSIRVS